MGWDALVGACCATDGGILSYSSALDGRDTDKDEEADDGRDDKGEGAGRSIGEKRLEAEKGEYAVEGAGDEPGPWNSAE